MSMTKRFYNQEQKRITTGDIGLRIRKYQIVVVAANNQIKIKKEEEWTIATTVVTEIDRSSGVDE